MLVLNPAEWLVDRPEPKPHTVLLVLNRKRCNTTQLHKIWSYTSHHVLLDGATDLIRPYNLVPDYVTGDGDSVSKEGLQWLESCGVPFQKDPDQYSTDFMKALKLVQRELPETKEIYAFGALGGRVDHHWHSILMLNKSLNASYRLYLMSSQNITMILKDEATIKTPQKILGKACGIAPVEFKAKICLRGFAYDVDDFDTSWESNLSTSNYLAADEVYVAGTCPLLVTIELGELADDRG